MFQRKQEFDQRQKDFDVVAVSMGTAVPKQKGNKENEEKNKSKAQKVQQQESIIKSVQHVQEVISRD